MSNNTIIDFKIVDGVVFESQESKTYREYLHRLYTDTLTTEEQLEMDTIYNPFKL